MNSPTARWIIWCIAGFFGLDMVGFAIWVLLKSLSESVPDVPVTTPPETVARKTKIPEPKETVVPRLEPRVIVDSQMTRAEALGSNDFPRDILARMELVEVEYLGFDNLNHLGQIVVDRRLAKEVREIFDQLKRLKFPIEKVIPVVKYGWDDQRSMDDNNMSGFNYRGIITPFGESKTLSMHAFGRSIDLNPLINPYLPSPKRNPPRYDPARPGTLTRTTSATRVFLAHGWEWGGNWSGAKDYQHFEKH